MDADGGGPEEDNGAVKRRGHLGRRPRRLALVPVGAKSGCCHLPHSRLSHHYTCTAPPGHHEITLSCKKLADISRMRAESVLLQITQDYQELNGSHYETLDGPPSPVQFSRIVHISRPALFRGCFTASQFPALQHWNDGYICDKMQGRPISVAVTPDGRADALVSGTDAKTYFVEPYSQQMAAREFFAALSSVRTVSIEEIPSSHLQESALQSSRQGQLHTGEVCYLQSQNGNLYSGQSTGGSTAEALDEPSEFMPLRGDVPKHIEWATDALGRGPDAVNLWIGDERSVTSVHSDPYENLYTVVRGSKTFVLLPPTEGWLLREQRYPHATYTRPSPGSPLELIPSPANHPTVRWASVDPTRLSAPAAPLRITVNAGETLYLPSGWWHHVSQRGDGPDGKGVCIAVNWWYDMEMRGMGWVWMSLLRRLGGPSDESVEPGSEDADSGSD
ncbi:hypothetical protein BOTBODRAFT_317485 [Botryobasidium botryosum FD-172 SS1]|uniref:JmjC domain-containing protein n=1 Tax=Botryobasidium botryosum (strain FD-172 SS1) TaxID=930990 RepID=A0A067MYB5_BOTB1|nr:hypothetical protein BOTBODRAFT_317485 [Botryobasidium botryosum FD-172 SS1]